MRLWLFLPTLLLACTPSETAADDLSPETETETDAPRATLVSDDQPDPFAQYWYAGKAEVNSYDLQQSRYGQTRSGDAVLVFVTEPFLEEQQVKADDPNNGGAVTVLKTNAMRKFHTGIYDYSTMLSVFTPVSTDRYPKTLKTTFSGQDWCGQVFQQLNLDGGNYRTEVRSYFETEGDANERMKATLLEDELLNRIRLDPTALPTGTVDLIPGALYARLLHRDQTPKQTRVALDEGNQTTTLTVEYLHVDRTLRVEFETRFPHKILNWSERDGEYTSIATLRETLLTPYWSQNGRQYQGLRDSLQLIY